MNYHPADVDAAPAVCMGIMIEPNWKTNHTTSFSAASLSENAKVATRAESIGGVALSHDEKMFVLKLLESVGNSEIKTLSRAYISDQSITSGEA